MSEDLVERLRTIEHFKSLRRPELLRIASLAARLRQVSLFDSLSDKDLAYIAELGQLERHECDERIIRQGDLDKTFYVLLEGQVRAWVRDEQGKPRLLNYHGAGDFFGEMALLDDAPRAASVDVMDDAVMVAFGPQGFERILSFSQIGDYLRSWGQERIRRSNLPFEGKQWDEITVIKTHKSVFAFLIMTIGPVFLFVVAVTAWIVVSKLMDVSSDCMLSLVIAVTVGMGLWLFWIWEDWRNDDLIVTSKRVIHIERVLIPPFPLERHEAPITQVQDITTRRHGLWTQFLGVYSLEIKTAAGTVIQFPYVEDVGRIRDAIFYARQLAQTRRAGEERSQIRKKLLAELRRPVQEVQPLRREEPRPVTPERKGLAGVLDYFVPRSRIVKQDQIVWRKHWLVLLRGEVVPVPLMGVALGWLALALAGVSFLGQLPWYLSAGPPLLLFLGAFGAYVWIYDGWRNDIYAVTDTRVIDIEGTPFHLFKETRTEGTFDVVQDINYSSPGLVARILRIGDVTIDTAAKKAAFTFDSVPRPEEVQQEIFDRLMAFRERRQRDERERQYTEFARWFETYHRSVIEQEGRSDGI